MKADTKKDTDKKVDVIEISLNHAKNEAEWYKRAFEEVKAILEICERELLARGMEESVSRLKAQASYYENKLAEYSAIGGIMEKNKNEINKSGDDK